MARSDIATESHNTNGLNALKNFVMDVDGYIGLYSIQNGNEAADRVPAVRGRGDIQLNHRVLKVGKTEAGRYQLNMMNGKGPETRDFDLVLMCLPHSWLTTMGWDGEALPQVDGQARRLFRPARALSCAFRSCSTSRSGATESRAPGSCRKPSAAAASTMKGRATMSASMAS